MPVPIESCETCRYYRVAATPHGAFEGQCHRYAPQPSASCVQPWPFVFANAWCGEWERAEPPPLPEPEPPGQATSVELVAGTPRPQ